MVEVENPSNIYCYAPSSESFRIYKIQLAIFAEAEIPLRHKLM
jgi:hypothetical protein